MESKKDCESSITIFTAGQQFWIFARKRALKPGCHPSGWHPWRAVASFLIEEGCHSAGFVTTIHLRHHLLLSIGLRFNLFAPNLHLIMPKVCHISFRMSMGEIRLLEN